MLETSAQMLRDHWQWIQQCLDASARLRYHTPLAQPASHYRNRTPDRLLLALPSLVDGVITDLLLAALHPRFATARTVPIGPPPLVPPASSPLPPLQHYLTMLGSTVVIPALLVPAMGGTAQGGSRGREGGVGVLVGVRAIRDATDAIPQHALLGASGLPASPSIWVLLHHLRTTHACAVAGARAFTGTCVAAPLEADRGPMVVALAAPALPCSSVPCLCCTLDPSPVLSPSSPARRPCKGSANVRGAGGQGRGCVVVGLRNAVQGCGEVDMRRGSWGRMRQALCKLELLYSVMYLPG